MTKTVLITGSAVRIGRAIALSLAYAGWDIAIHYRSSAEQAGALAQLITEKGRKAHLVQADLADSNAVSRIVPSLAARDVHLDCVINNASMFEKNSFAELTHANLQSHMDVNCFAPLQIIRDFAAHYDGDEGNVINITDGMEGWSMSPVFFSYMMSKRALAVATELLARSLAPRIRINAIAPGAMLEGHMDDAATFEKLRGIIPLHRTGSPDEVANAVRYILSAPSLTGQTILLSGGLHTHPQWAV